MNDILYISPKRLTPAPELAVVPMMGAVAARYQTHAKADLRAEGAELAAELATLHAQLAENGILDPLPVTYMAEKVKGKKHPRQWVQFWDGRHRCEWALATEQKTVPVRVVTVEEGRAIMAATVFGRRHWTKGQRAWLAVNLHPAVAGNTKGRPGKSDSIGIKSHSVGITVDEIAARFGVSATLIDQSVKIYRVFTELPALREKYEPGIWLGHGLGAVLAGIPGADATAGKPKVPMSWASMAGPLAGLNRVAATFEKWSKADQEATRDALSTWMAKLPACFRLTLTEAVAAASEAGDAQAA